jgi:hypothetical protein
LEGISLANVPENIDGSEEASWLGELEGISLGSDSKGAGGSEEGTSLGELDGISLTSDPDIVDNAEEGIRLGESEGISLASEPELGVDSLPEGEKDEITEGGSPLWPSTGISFESDGVEYGPKLGTTLGKSEGTELRNESI